MNLKRTKEVAFVAASALISLTSCVSTLTEEPSSVREYSDELVITLSPPEEVKTRADLHEGYTLRYVAKVIPFVNKQLGSVDETKTKRKEILDDSNGTSTKELRFQVDQDKDYRIVVFADYIKDKTPNSEGNFRDCFYDTSSKNEIVRMFTTPSDPSNSITGNDNSFSDSFFNNDNYDCFSASSDTYKDAFNVRIPMNLKRAVAKVQFIDESTNKGTLDKVYLSKLGIFNNYNISNGSRGGSFKEVSTPKTFDSSKLTIDNDNSFFYFYTFAFPDTSNPTKISVNISTSIKESDNNINIQKNDITVMRNYKTQIKGILIQQKPNSDSTDNNDPSLDLGNEIILDMTTNHEWQNTHSEPF